MTQPGTAPQHCGGTPLPPSPEVPRVVSVCARSLALAGGGPAHARARVPRPPCCASAEGLPCARLPEREERREGAPWGSPLPTRRVCEREGGHCGRCGDVCASVPDACARRHAHARSDCAQRPYGLQGRPGCCAVYTGGEAHTASACTCSRMTPHTSHRAYLEPVDGREKTLTGIHCVASSCR